MATLLLDSVDDALEPVVDGCVLATGGAGLARKPIAALLALIARGPRNLELVTFVGSLDVELLVAAGCVSAVRSASVSLGPAGRASAFAEGAANGSFEDLEESEWMLLGRLRAAAAGLAFMPTRAAIGSQLLDRARVATVVDPYSGAELLALPPLRPDVALIHAWRADEQGNVQFTWPRDHLWDVDVLLARAARRTIVTVERIVPAADIVASAEHTVLHPFDVDVLVEVPGGAAPTSSPPDYGADPERVASVAADIVSSGRRSDLAARTPDRTTT
jgi:glutaconate CoA-transferase subunit A